MRPNKVRAQKLPMHRSLGLRVPPICATKYTKCVRSKRFPNPSLLIVKFAATHNPNLSSVLRCIAAIITILLKYEHS